MKLNQLTIIAAPTEDPTNTSTYTWKDGDELSELASAIEALCRYREDRLNQLKTALASQPPIPVP